MTQKKANEVAEILKKQIVVNDPRVSIKVIGDKDDCTIYVSPSEGGIISGWWLSRVVMFVAAYGYSVYITTLGDEKQTPVMKIYN